jgi:hypothetical protein
MEIVVTAEAPDTHKSAPEPRAIAAIRFLYISALLSTSRW